MLGSVIKFGVSCGPLRGKFARNQSKGMYTTKMLSKKYYKGKGAPPAGRHTRKGGYVVEPWRTFLLDVPHLASFKLKPYVSHSTPLISPSTVITPAMQKQLLQQVNADKLKALNENRKKRGLEPLEALPSRANRKKKASSTMTAGNSAASQTSTAQPASV